MSQGQGLIPNIFWFRFAVACPRVDGVTVERFDKDWSLPESCKFPDTALLSPQGEPGWADIRAAWNPGGLILTVAVKGRKLPTGHPPVTEAFKVWIDTRDTRDVHRATRHCHRFGFLVDLPTVQVNQRPIARALADAPTAPKGSVKAKAAQDKSGWSLKLFFTPESLHGFDPETNRRLGITYQVTDPQGQDQFLGPGSDFPIGEDPSLWSTLELRD